MGLKKNNYKIESLDLVLPTAYALIKSLHITNKGGEAEFVVQRNRELAENVQPLEIKKVAFEVIRAENPFVTAYNKAKSVTSYSEWDEEKQEYVEKVKYGAFFGWDDDIPS